MIFEAQVKIVLFILLLQLRGLVCHEAKELQGGEETQSPALSKIYVYDDEVFHHRKELEQCDPGGRNGKTTDTKHGLGDVLLQYVHDNDTIQVTNDPEEASWFLVPFNIDRSFHERNFRCGQTHLMRLQSTLTALEGSIHYQRYKGANHVWYIGGWQLTTAALISERTKRQLPYFPFERHLIHNMAIITYSDRRIHLSGTQPQDDEIYGEWEIVPDTRRDPRWWAQGMDHRCSVNVPFRSNPAIEVYHPTIRKDQQTLEGWEAARPYLFHYIGAGENYGYHPGQKQGVHQLIAMWHKTAKGIPSDKVFSTETPVPAEEFAKSLSKSRFCIVMRGDDPSRSRYGDAISAGCIPVVISDGYMPFGAGHTRKMLNYETFTISIAETHFLTHGPSALHYAVTSLNRNELREMHRSIMKARPLVLWEIDGEESRVAELTIEQLDAKCRLDKEEMVSLYSKDGNIAAFKKASLPSRDETSEL